MEAIDFNLPKHRYFTQAPTDRFSRIHPQWTRSLAEQQIVGEKEALISLLKALDISPHSQMLVFSTTSLQLSLIRPGNPRAIYFNDDTYVGYIPGGKIELISIDPELGGIFYMFDLPRSIGAPVRPERSDRCMNCHAGEDTSEIPGLVVKSVVPGPSGGSLRAFRQTLTGHEIPLADRFGGWVVTGVPSFTNHWGNKFGRSSPSGITYTPVEPGKSFTYDRYLVPSSDLLPQLLHEHQAGFINRAVALHYQYRSLAEGNDFRAALKEPIDSFLKYLLFAEEPSLETLNLSPSQDFVADFRKQGPATVQGKSLREIDGSRRLLRHRCSYMLYSPAFQGLPKPLKEHLKSEILRWLGDDALCPWIPSAERGEIVAILRETGS